MLLAYLAGTYLLASVSFPQLFARAHGVDLHAVGTRNLGAGNLVRAAGIVPGVTAGLLDALKPPLAMLFVAALGAERATQVACGVVAVAAQQWPLWHRFDGGRGNSPALALCLALSLPASIVASVLVFAGLAPGTIERLRSGRPVFSRGTPLGIFAAFAAFPLVALAQQADPLVAAAGIVTTLLIAARRLTAGLRADLAISDDVTRTLANRLLFDRTEAQRRALS